MCQGAKDIIADGCASSTKAANCVSGKLTIVKTQKIQCPETLGLERINKISNSASISSGTYAQRYRHRIACQANYTVIETLSLSIGNEMFCDESQTKLELSFECL